MRPATTTALTLAGAGVVLGTANVWLQGPLPGDVAVTRLLQTAATGTDWAEAVTSTAKHPLLWGAFVLSLTIAWTLRKWCGVILVAFSFILSKVVDFSLRAVIYTPKPSADLVTVAKFSDASGFPSTFALVYGALFGTLLILAAESRRAPGWRRWSAGLTATALLTAGVLSRTVLGGHWLSQMLASLCLIMALTLLAQHILEKLLPGE